MSSWFQQQPIRERLQVLWTCWFPPVKPVLTVPQEELVELVLSQQSSPSGSSAPDTPTVTSDPPDPTPRISVSDSSSDASSPSPPTVEPEAPPPDSETPPSDADLEEDDPVSSIEDLFVRPARFG